MPNIDPVAALKLQPELLSGESILLGGHAQSQKDFSFRRLGFDSFQPAVGWFRDFLGSDRPRLYKFRSEVICSFGLFVLCTLGHSLCSVWSIYNLGRFIVDSWLKRRTFYAVTNRRVLLFQEGWKPKKRLIFLECLPEISREGTAIGTLWLGPKLPTFGSRGSRLRGMSRFSEMMAAPANPFR